MFGRGGVARGICAAILVAFLIPALARAEQITVFAASSLKTTLDPIAQEFTRSTGHEVTLSFAGSSALARQLRLGAPADVFISANVGWMDVLAQDGVIDPQSRVDLLTNSLVLIAPAGQGGAVDLGPDGNFAAVLGDGVIAMALTEAVPAGIYGKAAFEALALWPQIADQVVQAQNVRAALAFVARGEADFGVVYATDALAEPAVTVVAAFPPASHPPIIYPAATVQGMSGPVAADFLTFLQGAFAGMTFAQHGFTLLSEQM